MYSKSKKIFKRNYLFIILFTILLLSLYMEKFYLEVGFALKPFIISLFILVFCVIVFDIKLINKLYNYEKIFLIFFSYTIIRGSFSKFKLPYFRLFLGFLIIFTFYYFVSILVYKLDYNILFKILNVVSMVFILVSLTTYFLGDHINNFGLMIDRGMFRLTGTINDPNMFVVYASLLYGISLYYFLKNNTHKFSLLISIIAILLTFSRGGVLGISFLTILVISKFKEIKFTSLLK